MGRIESLYKGVTDAAESRRSTVLNRVFVIKNSIKLSTRSIKVTRFDRSYEFADEAVSAPRYVSTHSNGFVEPHDTRMLQHR